MTDLDFLRGDCGRCIGLCCVALSFDRGPHFAFDKPAGEACRFLSVEHKCRIHHRLATSGMVGCVRFDCLGAGQLVTAMFPGFAPGDSPATSRAMSLAFARTREIQTLRHLLRDTPTNDAIDLDASLEQATTSYASLLQFDLAAARRATSAIVLATGRPSCRPSP